MERLILSHTAPTPLRAPVFRWSDLSGFFPSGFHHERVWNTHLNAFYFSLGSNQPLKEGGDERELLFCRRVRLLGVNHVKMFNYKIWPEVSQYFLVNISHVVHLTQERTSLLCPRPSCSNPIVPTEDVKL